MRATIALLLSLVLLLPGCAGRLAELDYQTQPGKFGCWGETPAAIDETADPYPHSEPVLIGDRTTAG